MARYRGTTAQRGLGAPHVADKKRLMAIHRDGDPCWRCGQPMYKSQGLQRGHIIDRALGGADGPAALEHASCNLSAGARLGNRLQPRVIMAAGHDVICGTCGKPYHYAARACEICGVHYHPSGKTVRTCSRAHGVELRRQLYGTTGRSPMPAAWHAARQAAQAERQAAAHAAQETAREATRAERDARQAERARQIRALRAGGATWAAIAAAVGLSGPGAACNAARPAGYREYQNLRSRW